MAVSSRNSPGFGKRWHLVLHHALRLGRRMLLLFLLLFLSPGLVVIVPLVAVACATPISVVVLVYAHLPSVWGHVRPYIFQEAFEFEQEKLAPCMPVEPETPAHEPSGTVRSKVPEIVPWPVSPPSPASGYLSAEDISDLKEGISQDKYPDPGSPQFALLADHEENMTWGGRTWMQESLVSSGSTSPSYYSASPSRSPHTGQDEALARKLRKDVVGLKRFVGDKSSSQGPLLKEIEDLGTFLGIDLPLTEASTSDLRRAKECLDLLKLVVGVQFR